MRVNELLSEAGKALGYPVAQDIYEGSSGRNITFTYEDERDTLVADDEGKAETVYLMVSMNTPQDYDYFEDKEKLKRELQKRGFNIQHIQTWLENAKVGIKRMRRTIFTVNITKTVKENQK